MPPGCVSLFASFPNHSRQNSVPVEAFGAMNFTGVDVGLARVASRVDQELRPQLTQQLDQDRKTGIIGRSSRDHGKRQASPSQIFLNGTSDVAVSPKKQNHSTPAKRTESTGKMEPHSLSCSANFVHQPMSVTVRFKGREKLTKSDRNLLSFACPFNR